MTDNNTMEQQPIFEEQQPLSEESKITIGCAQVQNANGIHQLQNGRLKEAMGWFKASLEQMERHVAAEGETSPRRLEPQEDDDQEMPLQMMMTVEVPAGKGNAEGLFAFTKAIHFHSGDEDEPTKNLTGAFCTCATIFNLALTFQVMAASGQNSRVSRDRFGKAFRLYDSVIQMADEAVGEFIQPDVAAFLKAVALNNQTWINYEIGAFETSKQQCEYLMTFVQNVYVDGCWADKSSEDLVGQFVLNSMFLTSTHVASAAWWRSSSFYIQFPCTISRDTPHHHSRTPHQARKRKC